MGSFNYHKFGWSKLDNAILFVLLEIDSDLVSDKEAHCVLVKEIPVSALGSELGAVVCFHEMFLVEDCDFFFGVFEEPPVFESIEHVKDHFSFSCAVSS